MLQYEAEYQQRKGRERPYSALALARQAYGTCRPIVAGGSGPACVRSNQDNTLDPPELRLSIANSLNGQRLVIAGYAPQWVR